MKGRRGTAKASPVEEVEELEVYLEIESSWSIVSTEHPDTGKPLVGIGCGEKIILLHDRESVERAVRRLRSAADRAWPVTPIKGAPKGSH